MNAEQEALASLSAAKGKRDKLDAAKEAHDRAKLRFIRDARAVPWSWARIGRALDLTDVAVRRYWERNRQRAGRTGRSLHASSTSPPLLMER